MNRIVDCTSLMNYAFIDFITTIILISLIFTTFLSLFPLASHPTLLSFTGYLTLLHPGTFYSSLVWSYPNLLPESPSGSVCPLVSGPPSLLLPEGPLTVTVPNIPLVPSSPRWAKTGHRLGSGWRRRLTGSDHGQGTEVSIGSSSSRHDTQKLLKRISEDGIKSSTLGLLLKDQVSPIRVLSMALRKILNKITVTTTTPFTPVVNTSDSSFLTVHFFLVPLFCHGQ